MGITKLIFQLQGPPILHLVLSIRMGLEMCIKEKCIDNDTVIVLLYAVFCVVFGFVTALLVRLADRMKGERGEAGTKSREDNAEEGIQNGGLEDVQKAAQRIEDIHRAGTQFTINRNISTVAK